MKRKIRTITMLALAIVMTIILSTISTKADTFNFYPNTFVVIETDTKNDIVICVDFNGGEWSFEGVEDWAVGDIVSAIMTDKGTKNFIYDDDFVEIKYIGWIDGVWGYDVESNSEIVSINK